MIRHKIVRGGFIKIGNQIKIKKDRKRDNSEEYEKAEKREIMKDLAVDMKELKSGEQKKRGGGMKLKPLTFKY